MIDKWRLLDTGVLSGAENMALDDVILECKSQGKTPNTLRFLQFNPATVLVGYHQSVKQEVRLEYCQRNGVEVNRRITGGGTILFTPTCLGWEIFADKTAEGIKELRRDLDRLARRICNGAVGGLHRLGVDAEFRPKNDIEINGRKISGTGGTERDGSFMYQGTLLVDFDVDLMLKTLRIPVEKLKDKEIDSVKERVTCLKWELGYVPALDTIKKAMVDGFAEVFGVEFEPEGLYSCEKSLFEERLPYFKSREWVYLVEPPKDHQGQVSTVRKTPGGLIRVSLALNIPGNFIVSSFITGDFQIFPQRAIMDLEAKLKNLPADEESITKAVHEFFDETGARIFGVKPDDLIQLILEAVKKRAFSVLGVSLEEANHLMTVNFMPDEVLEQHFDYLLLPYCAKLVDCEYRFVEGCDHCGGCSISNVYELALDLNMPVRTIQTFEHLIETIEEFKKKGARGYIGSCCEGFYNKHHDDFMDTEVPGLLVDIDDSTCYELGEEKEAYIGEFEGQTTLKEDLIIRIINALHERGRIGGKKLDE
ncbi:MAG: lipoyl protein ligase domain-containing protein [Candidatus Thorarchaeota archaeon]